MFDIALLDCPIFVIALDQTNLVTGQALPLVTVNTGKKGRGFLRCEERHECRVSGLCLCC